jgi:glutaminyl-peptide cyclotransferase
MRKRMMAWVAWVAGMSVLGLAGLALMATQGGRLPIYGYKVIASFPHDPDAFTQGLVYRDGVLYESAGQYGRSSLRKVRLDTGRILQERKLEARYFAEGLVNWESRLVQLTWQEGVAFVYDLNTLATERTFAYNGQGWGLTHDGSRLIMSDGSSTLKFLHPETFRELGTLVVRDGRSSVDQLNELEFVRGEIYANIWNSDRIARISPTSGQVLGWIDLTGLWPITERGNSDAVLNGIAYDAAGDRLFVTGKLWPKIYQIELVRR